MLVLVGLVTAVAVGGTATAGRVRGTPGDGSCPGCLELPADQLANPVDMPAMCACHYEDEQWYHHPVDVVPSERLAPRIPSWLPLTDGLLTCATCHDLAATCALPSAMPSAMPSGAPSTVRGGPFKARSEPCYACHDADAYQRFNVHEQLDARSRLKEDTCLYCHTTLPSPSQTASMVRLVDDIPGTCMRCHPMELHPGGTDHLRKPSADMLDRLHQLEDEHHVILPLDEQGRMSCITCHNPHQRGVIPVDRHAARGADEEHRLRIPRVMCRSCHDR